MEHSELYYTLSSYMKFTLQPEAKEIENQAGFDLFRIGYRLYEGQSGMMIQCFSRKRDLMDMVADLELDKGYQDQLKEKIKQWTATYGTSPRYTHPEQKRFTESHPEVRARGLHDNAKHTYVEVYNRNGLTFYARKSDMKRYNYPIYYLHQEWMFSVGNIYGLHHAAEKFYKHGPPDFNSCCTQVLDQQMDNPDIWASLGCAAYLGRMDEAKEHNKVILERQEAERQKRKRRDESNEQYFQEKIQETYGPLLAEAVHAIAAHRPVDNIKGPFSRSLILYLFDHYHICVPNRTQSRIMRNLQQISYDKANQTWAYTYGTSEPFNRSFPPLLDVLVQAISADHSGILADTIHVDVDEDEWER